MLEFVQKAMADAAEYFGKAISNELDLQKVIAQDQVQKLTAELKELKTEHIRDRDDMETRLRNAEVQKAELSALE